MGSGEETMYYMNSLGIYVGATTNPLTRWSSHKNTISSIVHTQPFKFRLLFQFDTAIEAKRKEQELIKGLDDVVNHMPASIVKGKSDRSRILAFPMKSPPPQAFKDGVRSIRKTKSGLVSVWQGGVCKAVYVGMEELRQCEGY